MKILAVTSGKGGVGKTTLSLNIARQLSLHGLRTLVLDFDVHNKGTTGMFLDKVTDSSPSIISIVEESKNFDKARPKQIAADVQPVPLVEDESLLLVPAARPREMIRWSTFVASNDQIVEFFRQLIEELTSKEEIDVVVIDCYGGIDTLTVAAAGVADDTIIVNEPDVVTFSGTLLLYRYLADTYADSRHTPNVHFVINRVTSRHTFHFLDGEYQKHLSGLAITKSILAYFQYDKLVMETFGDYPFFTELLPRSLITKKIKLLISALWKEDEFARILKGSERKKTKIYRRTSETPYADPERIIRAAVSAPIWLTIPIVLLTFLYTGGFGLLQSLPYRVIQTLYNVARLFILFIILFVGIFEPIQIGRWLLRNANYARRKRILKKQKNRMLNCLATLGAHVRPIIPVGLSLLVLAGIILYAREDAFWSIGPWRPHRDIAIWKKDVSGFKSGGDYSGLITSDSSSITEPNMQNVNLSYANLAENTLSGIDLSNANLRRAHLGSANLTMTSLIGAELTDAGLSDANLTEANLTSANLTRADLRYANLTNAKLGGADLPGAKLNSANLTNANLRGAGLAGADLSSIDLTNADLRGADLAGARLTSADLSGANLRDANLAHADLAFVVFRGANLRGADLTGIGYSDIENLACANVFDVNGAPEGFLDWAVREKLAVLVTRDDLWVYGSKNRLFVSSFGRWWQRFFREGFGNEPKLEYELKQNREETLRKLREIEEAAEEARRL